MEKARRAAAVCTGGLVYALFFTLGRYAEAGCPEIAAKWAAVFAASLAAALLLLVLLFSLSRKSVPAPAAGKPFRTGIAFGGILFCYVPMLLILFPGSFAYDVPYQLQQFFSGAFSVHHPLLHTLYLGACIALGRKVGNVNLGAALYTATQAAMLAGCFALTCASLARQNGRRTGRRTALFFALYPMHMIMACNATKDVLFSGAFVLFLALTREKLLLGGKDAKRDAGILLSGMLSVMLRNNAVYALAAGTVGMLIVLRKKGLRTCGCILLAAALGVGMNAGLKAALKAENGSIVEMLSLPIQQAARARKVGRHEIETQDKAAMDELMPDELWRQYDPTVSDPIKFGLDTEKLLADPQKYIACFLNMGEDMKKIYLDAAVLQTYPFLSPYTRYAVSGYYVQMGMTDEDCGMDGERITDESLFPELRTALEWRFGAQGAMQIPVVGWLFNMGVIVWIMLFFALRSWYLGEWKQAALSLVPLCLWGTFLLGPVMAGRYIYCFMCVLPVLACRGVRTAHEEV